MLDITVERGRMRANAKLTCRPRQTPLGEKMEQNCENCRRFEPRERSGAAPGSPALWLVALLIEGILFPWVDELDPCCTKIISIASCQGAMMMKRESSDQRIYRWKWLSSTL
jgi:hypothetical protein